ncbi:MAG: HAMP domain-containing protein [Deltaproteobacteria bacterium]|nr:HAMP domain-containing protein [Deltaproteobacteria bacterium]
MRLQLHHRLIVMTVALVVVVIVCLATYLSSRQLHTLTEALRRKAAAYGTIMADGARSAVAFSDRETARETLSALDRDPEVASVTLYGSDGSVLYRRGISEVADRRSLGSFTTSSHLAIVTEVVALEGPRGTLAIEISTSSLDDAHEEVVRVAVIAGALALLVSLLVAWAIARRLSRRLRKIAGVASAVADGDLTQRPIDDRGSDEIGTVAVAFDAMLGQLRLLIERQAEMARREQERLEAIVAERTAELDRKNAEMQLVFDHVDQGFLIVDRAGVVGSDRSAAVDRWLGATPEMSRLPDYIRGFDADAADWIDLQWEMLRDGSLPPEICLAQMPAHLTVQGRRLELAYQTLTDARGDLRVLVVLSDATARFEREQAERDERELSSLFARMLRGGAGFLAFHAEVDSYVAEISYGSAGASLGRTIHTLKGVAALEGVGTVASLCHELETALGDQDEGQIALLRRAIVQRWTMLSAKLEPLIRVQVDRIDLRVADLEALEAALERGASRRELIGLVEGLRHERVSTALERLAEDARSLAKHLGKDPVEICVEVDETLRLPCERWSPFWSAAIHAIRNAVDHGLEPAEERIDRNKAATPRLALRARRRLGFVEIEIADDGRGIDWDALARSARARGMAASTRGELVEALFSDGVSTRDEITETSGRGIGMAALRHAVVASGGAIEVTSSAAGTTFGFLWPESVVFAPSVTPLAFDALHD